MAFDFPSSPTTGQTYSVTGGPTYVYNGTAWVVLTSGNQFNRTVFTATAGQTTFTMNYVVGAIDVYRNGVKLAPADFTATNGTSIVLANGCSVGDTVEVISYPMITYSDAVKRTGDTMTGALAVPSLTVNSVPVLAGPAFLATASTNQTGLALATYHKVALNTEVFDTNNNYDPTLYRFTPTVEGYYQVNWTVQLGGSTNTTAAMSVLYKNGSIHRYGFYITIPSYPWGSTVSPGSALVYMNGSTDYLEVYGTVSGSGTGTISAATCSFSASLTRAA